MEATNPLTALNAIPPQIEWRAGVPSQPDFIGVLRTPIEYNATAVTEADGKIVCLELVQAYPEPDGTLRVYRANGLWSGDNGTLRYHNAWLAKSGRFGATRIVMDGGGTYKRGLSHFSG